MLAFRFPRPLGEGLRVRVVFGFTMMRIITMVALTAIFTLTLALQKVNLQVVLLL
jgi:hypothetical protein